MSECYWCHEPFYEDEVPAQDMGTGLMYHHSCWLERGHLKDAHEAFVRREAENERRFRKRHVSETREGG